MSRPAYKPEPYAHATPHELLALSSTGCLGILVSSQRASDANSEASLYRNEESEMKNHQLYTPGIHLRTTLSKTVWHSG